MSSDMDVLENDYDVSRYNAIVDLRAIGWKSIDITGLLLSNEKVQ